MSMRNPWSATRMMIGCHWTARRLQRYLDADPSARLEAREVARLEAHLADCERCTALLSEYRGLQKALARWAIQAQPDPEAVARLNAFARSLSAEESR